MFGKRWSLLFVDTEHKEAVWTHFKPPTGEVIDYSFFSHSFGNSESKRFGLVLR